MKIATEGKEKTWNKNDYHRLEDLGNNIDSVASIEAAKSTGIPHRGSLCRIKLHSEDNEKSTNMRAKPFSYEITIKDFDMEEKMAFDEAEVQLNTETTRNQNQHQLQFSADQYIFLENIFSILDTESTGLVHQNNIRDFVMLRCPVFSRRDADLMKHHGNDPSTSACDVNPTLEQTSATLSENHEGQTEFDTKAESKCDKEHRTKSGPKARSGCQSPTTFAQVWDVVVSSALNYNPHEHCKYSHLGIEGWMIFCRFISLVQYHDAKRRFSARHLQTIQNKNEHEQEQGQEASELIIVDLPPLLEPPTQLDVQMLIEYDELCKNSLNNSIYGDAVGRDDENVCGIPLPELDLDHSYISIYDDFKNIRPASNTEGQTCKQKRLLRPLVCVSVFGSKHLYSNSLDEGTDADDRTGFGGALEFIIKYAPNGDETDAKDMVVVRRSFDDLEWLNQTFKSHKPLGGTLCGRILPPFPSRPSSANSDGGVVDRLYQKRNSSNSGVDTAVAVASVGVSVGVGMVSTAAKTAKSLWGSFPGSKKIKKIVKEKVQSQSKSVDVLPKGSYSTKKVMNSYDTPTCKARQMEKYLNYMLEHPALSSSFPLNTILQASQSGLDAAKRILRHQTEKNVHVGFNCRGSNEDEKALSLPSSVFQYLPSPSQTKNLEWVRSAAQAALVLQLHGVLETAGYQSTSTKLQHASLPRFASNNVHDSLDSAAVNRSERREMDGDSVGSDEVSDLENDDEYDGFDILPDPLPLAERSALCAGSIFPNRSVGNAPDTGSYCTYSVQTKDRYGAMQHTSLGDMEVERDIDRLRDLLRKVDKSFAMCCNALIGINKHRRSRDVLHVSILRSIDNWEGMRGIFLSQLSLLKGVTCLESASKSSNDSYTRFGEDMLWTSSLAKAAYKASKDVCHAVGTARTASRAKHTADIAVQNATQAESEGSVEDAEGLHEAVSKAQMQALHAAVVDHEATTAKRRSVISLANDVKYWNKHRKRELIKACSKVVQEQKLAVEQNLKAWNLLKEGFLVSPHVLAISKEKLTKTTYTDNSSQNRGGIGEGQSLKGHVKCYVDEDDVSSSMPSEQNDAGDVRPSELLNENGQNDDILATSSFLMPSDLSNASTPLRKESSNGIQHDYFAPSSLNRNEIDMPKVNDYRNAGDVHGSVFNEPDEAVFFADALECSAISHDSINDNSTSMEAYHDASYDRVSDGDDTTRLADETQDDSNQMTDSMQSLVDGLLNWGGGNWDADDDLGLVLPKGMAASIASLAMEEQGILDLS